MASRKSLILRLQELGSLKLASWHETFAELKINYPPAFLRIVALKEEKQLEIYAGNELKSLKKIKTWPILAASGHIGPKIREGDRQVPEGIYSVDFLNPNSLYHLSIKLNYPNEFDRLKAQSDNRFSLGNNIMIHGNQVSKGCIAIGDDKIEDLFLLAGNTGLENIKAIIAPLDFRTRPVSDALNNPGLPAWAEELYQLIKIELDKLDNP
jgi:hypothetical protein